MFEFCNFLRYKEAVLLFNGFFMQYKFLLPFCFLGMLTCPTGVGSLGQRAANGGSEGLSWKDKLAEAEESVGALDKMKVEGKGEHLNRWLEEGFICLRIELAGKLREAFKDEEPRGYTRFGYRHDTNLRGDLSYYITILPYKKLSPELSDDINRILEKIIETSNKKKESMRCLTLLMKLDRTKHLKECSNEKEEGKNANNDTTTHKFVERGPGQYSESLLVNDKRAPDTSVEKARLQAFLPIRIAETFELTNGLTSMNRDVLLKLTRLLSPSKIRTLFGACAEYFNWRRHRFFITTRIKNARQAGIEEVLYRRYQQGTDDARKKTWNYFAKQGKHEKMALAESNEHPQEETDLESILRYIGKPDGLVSNSASYIINVLKPMWRIEIHSPPCIGHPSHIKNPGHATFALEDDYSKMPYERIQNIFLSSFLQRMSAKEAAVLLLDAIEYLMIRRAYYDNIPFNVQQVIYIILKKTSAYNEFNEEGQRILSGLGAKDQ